MKYEAWVVLIYPRDETKPVHFWGYDGATEHIREARIYASEETARKYSPVDWGRIRYVPKKIIIEVIK